MKIDFQQEIILENDRALLRPLKAEDLSELMHFSLNEPQLWQYSLISGAGAENMEKYIELALQDRAHGQSYPFLVFDKQSGKAAGSTRFYDYQAGHNTVQLGYTWYGEAFQGTGLNKNCKYLILRLAFEEWGLDRVEFRADNNNLRSIQAMKSIGCVEEGVLGAIVRHLMGEGTAL